MQLRSRLAAIVVICFLRLLCPAQDSSTGAITGTVVDASGGRIANASVVIVNTSTGFRYAGTTNPDGQFSFELLPPAIYSGRATAEGMSPQLSPQLRVEVGGTTEIEFKLPVAGAKETITVAGDVQAVDTQPSTVGSVIDERAISELPINGRRFTDLVLLTPGVTQDPRGLTSGSNGDLAFGGIRGFQTSYLVDGGDNNNAFYAEATGRYRAPYQFSNEVVQEFRVSANTYGAEMGRAGGGVVNVITKSGSNQFHGTAFYYIRDSNWGATQEFMGGFKPHGQQQQFGFTFGGPIKRNKAFFFAGWDQHIFHVPSVVQFDNGGNVVVPQPGTGPYTPGDYEASDQALVFATAAQLSKQAGTFPSAMLGNAGFFKLDFTLSPHNTLALRLNSSRYSGYNNVFLDPGSPTTTFGITENGSEDVATETGSLALTSNISYRFVSHLRAQFSEDLEHSSSNSTTPITRIPGIIDGFGRSSILPRQTREHKFHLAQTFGVESGRNSWKFGGDMLLAWVYDFFPSSAGGEYIFNPIKVNPFTFVPMESGLELTPLRAYAHDVPHYYIQNFGPAITNPDSNNYAAFIQDTVRVTDHLALTLGVRYDLQTYTKKGLVTNPIWPDSGKVPFTPYNFAPRTGLAYSIGNDRPLVIRAGYGLFYTRIPQIYNSTVQSENGLSSSTLFLNNNDYYARQVFPAYPNQLVNCPPMAAICTPPASLAQFTQSEISAFANNFQTPRVQQASLSMEREIANRVIMTASYTYVHGEDLIRAVDENLPPPVTVEYPVYNATGTNFLGTYYSLPSFSTLQYTQTLTCPFPPCINPLARPIPQAGPIDVYQSAASSWYNGMTVSLRRRMTSGMYFLLSYTFAHAMDDGQDALVAGRPSTVQNSYDPSAEKGNSVTDQRHRLALSWVTEPRPFRQPSFWLEKMFNNWKCAGVLTAGSGRPVNPTVSGDPNQDGNEDNDRIPGMSRNSILGPDYSTTDLRLTRRIYVHEHLKLDLVAEAFNAFNRDNQRYTITDDGLETNGVQFVQIGDQIGIKYFPARFQVPSNPFRPNAAFPARQVQLALRMSY